jgi:hypothetical protein
MSSAENSRSGVPVSLRRSASVRCNPILGRGSSLIHSACRSDPAAYAAWSVYPAATVSSHSLASCNCSKDRHSMPAGAAAWIWLTESLPK